MNKKDRQKAKEQREADLERLQRLTAYVDGCQELECDGASRIVGLALHRARVPFKMLIGFVTWKAASGRSYTVNPHIWVEALGFVIDYRLRMWTEEEADHGVFYPDGDLVYRSVSTLPFDLGVAAVLEDVFNVYPQESGA